MDDQRTDREGGGMTNSTRLKLIYGALALNVAGSFCAIASIAMGEREPHIWIALVSTAAAAILLAYIATALRKK
jgi:hypothetical protein